ncbi:hypothetical protein Bbelb_371530 [Branchiostoma belcheri]|nr:hypothetical protein Bbelb_371530 [Branchiostoma belcheri]
MLRFNCLAILTATVSGQGSAIQCEGRSDGVYADLEDCTVYHLCHGGRDYQIRCPDGYFWSDDVHSCRLADIAQCCSGQGVCEATSYAEDVTMLSGRVQTLEADSADVQAQVNSLTTENTALRTQLTSLQGEANNLTIEKVNLVDDILCAHRTSWAMISKKGSKTSWFVEDERDRYAGPTVVEAEIPLSV